MPGIVGRSLGAMRSVASVARSTGGRAAQGVTALGTTMGTFGRGYASRGGRVARGFGGALGATGRTMAKYPKSTMGAVAGGIGYMGYRGVKGSQNNPIQGLE